MPDAIGINWDPIIMKPGTRQNGSIFKVVRFLFSSMLFLASITPSWALAQSADEVWTEPFNLSRSGLGIDPGIVVDSGGIAHALWQDDLANYMYTRLDGEQWGEPQATELDTLFRLPITVDPTMIYTGPNPLLISGPGQYVYAFWISPEGRLYTSKVENQYFEAVAAWDSGRVLSSEAASFAVALDSLGELHLAYVVTIGSLANPPGLYYMRTQNGGQTWIKPVFLYESAYLRRLAGGEANISIATGGTQDALHVYIAWDNRPRKQVLLVQSADGGASWDQPKLVASPAPDIGLAAPFNVQVGAIEDNAVLVWQDNRPDGTCAQFYQLSTDSGNSWSLPQPMLEDLVGCAISNEFIKGLANGPAGPLYLLTEMQSQVYLTAWNGRQWSQSQVQRILSGFEEPEIFTEVTLGCHQASLSGERLYVVGCDQGVGGDVWVTSRGLEANASLFSSPAWSQPAPVTDELIDMEAVELVATDEGLIHAFFSRQQDSSIYYTFWNGELWSNITPVLELPDGDASWPAIAAGTENKLFLIARSNSGMIYFSRAISSDAISESRWSEPTILETEHGGQISSLDIAGNVTGTLFVVYSVPVNEQRGIYLLQSTDDGATWSKPLQVFDGEAAGFDLVGAPSLLITANGGLHITWKQQSIQGDGVSQSISLYYARSEDSGRTFSSAELVIEEPVTWREIVVDGSGNLHLLWQSRDRMTTVWDQVSLDNGQTWQFPQGLPNEGMAAAIVNDSAGQIHLVDSGPGSLAHWLWDGSRWLSEIPLHWSLEPESASPVDLLAAAVDKHGTLVVVMAVSTGDAATGKTILYSIRTLELPSTSPTAPVSSTHTLPSPTLPASTPTPEVSPTVDKTVATQPTDSQGQTDPGESNARISPYTLALIPVALLLLSVLGIVIRRATRIEDR